MPRSMTHFFHLNLISAKVFWKHNHPLLHDSIAALMMFGIGFAPILALALTLLGVCSLPLATMALVAPALVSAFGLSYHDPSHGRLMLQGFLRGVMAVTCYDCVRIAFVFAGYLDDFIPQIGAMLVEDSNHHFIVGYLWRYLGNGGGLGLAFVSTLALIKRRLSVRQQQRMTPRLMKIIAIGFGVFVWICLIMTLKISPHGEDIMFVISPITLLATLSGHVVFGYALGCFVSRLLG